MTEIFGQSRMQQGDIDLICELLPDVGGRYVEIGSYCGASAARVLERKKDCHVLCIDNLEPGEGNPDLKTEDYVNLILNYCARRSRMNVFFGSVQDLRVPFINRRVFDLVVVDGSHSFEACYQDLCCAVNFISWNVRVLPTSDSIEYGKIVVHDYCSKRKGLKGVKQATDKFCEEFGWRVTQTRALSAVLSKL